MVIDQTSLPEGFNKADWQLYEGNKNHARFLPKCIELFWLIFECQQLTGEAFFGQEWLASRLEISVRHVQNLISELKSRNLIEIDRRDQNYYRVVEFFSHPLSYFTELARKKAIAAVAKLFPSMSSPNADAEKQASRPRKAATPKPAQAQQQAQVDEAQAAREREILLQEYEEAKALDDAYKQSDIEPVEKAIEEQVETIATEVVVEHKGKPWPTRQVVIESIKAKLEEIALKVPEWLITKNAIRIPPKFSRYFVRT